MRYVRIESDDAGMRLDNYLLRVFKDVPRSRVYRIIRSGEVRINSARARPASRLAQADEVRLPPVRQRAKTGPERPPDELMRRIEAAVIAQTDDYLVFAKPAGLAVHAGSGIRFGLIETLRAARPGAYVELVHRLDRQTSGCVLVARSRRALDGLRAALNSEGALKRYQALLDGRWPHGELTVDLPLSRDAERGGERMVIVDFARGRQSRSRFAPIACYSDATLMAVTIATGRTHQIRVHAAYKGYPVAADGKYGANQRRAHWRARGLKRMFLHAAQLEFDWQGERVTFVAPLPAELAAVLAHLEPMA